MVGLVIGMLAVIVVMQVFAQSEERKRVTTSGGDAQTNGIIAFYQLQNDISQAGYGFSLVKLFNCPIVWPVKSGGNIANPIRLAPITINPTTGSSSTDIIPAGDPNTDTLLVIYGNANGQPQGDIVQAASGNEYTVQMPTSFAVGNRVIAASDTCPGNLLLDEVTAGATGNVAVKTGAAGAALYNLGAQPRVLAYAIRGGNLTVCDYLVNDCGMRQNKDDPSIWTPVANNIVSMKAVYLRDTSTVMDGIPDADGHDQSTPSSGCGWARVPAVNLALVARSGQYNREVVNAPVPTWSENAAAIDLSADTNWNHYRYKVFEAVIPLRNVGWMGVPEGC